MINTQGVIHEEVGGDLTVDECLKLFGMRKRQDEKGKIYNEPLSKFEKYRLSTRGKFTDLCGWNGSNWTYLSTRLVM